MRKKTMNTIGKWVVCSALGMALVSAPISEAASGFLDDILGEGSESGVSDLLDSVVGGDKAPQGQSDAPLSNFEIGQGLREALTVGAERVVGQLGAQDGFNLDPEIHIPLPETLRKVQETLSAVGMASLVDDLELRLNRAAEYATPRAKALFFEAIEAMTLDDVRNILGGPDDAATSYFQGQMQGPLSDEMRPLVDQALNEAGAIRAYDNVMGEYDDIPFMPDVKADLTQHVLELGIAGIFKYIAIEEAAIRNNPVERTTDILRRVFG